MKRTDSEKGLFERIGHYEVCSAELRELRERMDSKSVASEEAKATLQGYLPTHEEANRLIQSIDRNEPIGLSNAQKTVARRAAAEFMNETRQTVIKLREVFHGN